MHQNAAYRLIAYLWTGVFRSLCPPSILAVIVRTTDKQLLRSMNIPLIVPDPIIGTVTAVAVAVAFLFRKFDGGSDFISVNT